MVIGLRYTRVYSHAWESRGLRRQARFTKRVSKVRSLPLQTFRVFPYPFQPNLAAAFSLRYSSSSTSLYIRLRFLLLLLFRDQTVKWLLDKLRFPGYPSVFRRKIWRGGMGLNWSCLFFFHFVSINFELVWFHFGNSSIWLNVCGSLLLQSDLIGIWLLMVEYIEFFIFI